MSINKIKGASLFDIRHGAGPRLSGANLFVGSAVYSGSGADLGYIKEVMLDGRTGKVAFAVLSSCDSFGANERLFAVPKEALTVDAGNERIVLDVEAAQLATAPQFANNKWPDMADPSWALGIHGFFGTCHLI
jgi:hypothetical protein